MNQPTSTAWSESSQLHALLARFPYMFPLTGGERKRAYIFFRGWMPTFALLCQHIDDALGSEKREFGWVRIREKFGAPSFSYEMRGRARHAIHAHRPTEVTRISCEPSESFDPTAVAIQEAVLQAELILRETCIVCGTSSKITNDVGPWTSLCVDHRKWTFVKSLENEAASVWGAAQLREA
mgnify:CR=1 FL=1